MKHLRNALLIFCIYTSSVLAGIASIILLVAAALQHWNLFIEAWINPISRWIVLSLSLAVGLYMSIAYLYYELSNKNNYENT